MIQSYGDNRRCSPPNVLSPSFRSPILKYSNRSSAVFKLINSEYVYIKCKLVFDPPSNTSLINTLESIADEIEWQLRLDAETEGGDASDG